MSRRDIIGGALAIVVVLVVVGGRFRSCCLHFSDAYLHGWREWNRSEHYLLRPTGGWLLLQS